MDKYIYDESNGLWYELQGDYYIPCITLPTEKEHKFIGLLLTTISKIPPPFCYLLLYSVLHLQEQYIIVVPYCQGQE